MPFVKYSHLHKKGWSMMAHQMPSSIMNNIVTRKNLYLEVSAQITGQHFNLDLTTFSEENLVAHELAKGITRAFLRYDPELFTLGKMVHKQVTMQISNLREAHYTTLPYAIIHLPDDTSEKGPMHKDGYYYIEDFHTTWTPLNDCNHEALAIVEYSHFEQGRLKRFRIPSLKPAHAMRKPNIAFGDFLTWFGNTDHEGLLNTSAGTTVAIVFRFTNTPIMLEATLPSSMLYQDFQQSNPDIHAFSSKMMDIYDQVAKENKQSAEKLNDIVALCEHVERNINDWNLSDLELHKVSCTLTLLAQRLETRESVAMFYLYACIASGHMLYPVQQLCIHLLENTTVANAERFMQRIIRRYPFRQHAFILNERMAHWNASRSHAYVNIPEKLPLLYWNK